MGVDIETYRGRIGTFKFAFGTDVITVECLINFSHGLKTIGSVAFIGLLLVMAGIESNPGPKEGDTVFKVAGIPPDVDEAYLTLMCINTKLPEGLQLDQQTLSATIELEDRKGTNKILSEIPVHITIKEENVEPMAKAASRTVEVKTFAKSGSSGQRKTMQGHYFKDEFSAGGSTKIRVQRGESTLKAFESKEETRSVDRFPEYSGSKLSTQPMSADPSTAETVHIGAALNAEGIHIDPTPPAAVHTKPAPFSSVYAKHISAEPLPTKHVYTEPLDTEILLTGSKQKRSVDIFPEYSGSKLSTKPMSADPSTTKTVHIGPALKAEGIHIDPTPPAAVHTEPAPFSSVYAKHISTEPLPTKPISTEPLDTDILLTGSKQKRSVDIFPEYSGSKLSTKPMSADPSTTKTVYIGPALKAEGAHIDLTPPAAVHTEPAPFSSVYAKHISTEPLRTKHVSSEPSDTDILLTGSKQTRSVDRFPEYSGSKLSTQAMSADPSTAKTVHIGAALKAEGIHIDPTPSAAVHTKPAPFSSVVAKHISAEPLPTKHVSTEPLDTEILLTGSKQKRSVDIFPEYSGSKLSTKPMSADPSTTKKIHIGPALKAEGIHIDPTPPAVVHTEPAPFSSVYAKHISTEPLPTKPISTEPLDTDILLTGSKQRRSVDIFPEYSGSKLSTKPMSADPSTAKTVHIGPALKAEGTHIDPTPPADVHTDPSPFSSEYAKHISTEPLQTKHFSTKPSDTDILLTGSKQRRSVDIFPEYAGSKLSTQPMSADPSTAKAVHIEPARKAEGIHIDPTPSAAVQTESAPFSSVYAKHISTEPLPTKHISTEPLHTETRVDRFPEYFGSKQSTKLMSADQSIARAEHTGHVRKAAGAHIDPTPSATVHTEPARFSSVYAKHISTEPLPTKHISTEPLDTDILPTGSKRNEPLPVNPLSFSQLNIKQIPTKPLETNSVPVPIEHNFEIQAKNQRVPIGKGSNAIKENNSGGQLRSSHTSGVDVSDIDVADSFTIHKILEILGLVDKYPGKIKLEDVLPISLTNKKANKTSAVPWVLLRQIIAVQSHARDTCLSDVEGVAVDDIYGGGADEFDFIDNSTTSNELSPLDVFNVTIQCCDNMLKQLLYKKMYLCKIAVPFVYIDRLSLEPKISVWPFRSTVVNSKVSVDQQESKSVEIDLLELPVKAITFARFGRTQCSKSKLINDLISEQIHDTFFNVDCILGSARRIISKGTIEMFLLPFVGNEHDRFSDAVSVFNMRGDIESDFNTDVLEFVSELSDTLVLIIDKVSLKNSTLSLNNVMSRFPSVVLVLDNPLNTKDKELLRNLKGHLNVPLTPVGTHKGDFKKNSKEIVANVKDAISSIIEQSKVRSIESRLSAVTTTLDMDENSECCRKGKLIASGMFEPMSEIEDKCKWKEIITPVNYIFSEKLGVCIKRLYRLKNVDDIGSVEGEIKAVRTKQLENVTKPMKMFIRTVTDSIQNASTMHYMFGWLGYLLERQKRLLLPQLIEQNLTCWKTLAILKQKGQSETNSELKRQVELTEASQKRIEDASLGIEHLFREVGHIYEAIMTLDKSFHPADLPSSAIVIEAIASLVVQGQPFELVDGDSFYMPTHWVHAVLEKVSIKIKKKPVLALAVLGLQSSGKSTLLNAMFGSQFPVKSGRCTRGIHMQLLPCTSDLHIKLPFEFILVIDTEGLRAPEINPNRTNHDNELSTMITGLGDVTLLNIMGENTSEIRDILQVVVHAFIRLRLVKKTSDIGKSFYLLHQNVVDISASDNMRTGLQVLMETLDTVSKVAAKSEGITDITTFNQVIKFDMTSNVWYLPNFWQGNPPMTWVNSGYSNRLVKEKTKLFETALSEKNKSYQNLNDIAVHMQDLWKGVLTEDFVYCFRNSLEIKAYVQLEETLKESLIKLENDVDEKRITFSQSEFSKCEQQHQLQDAFDEIIIYIQKTLADNESVAKECMKHFFENNEYIDTIIQWKEFTFNRIRLHCSELEDSMKLETMRLRDKTAIDILTAESSKQHEKELYDRSLRAAKETKGTNLSEQEIDMKFEETWKNILREIMNVGISSNTQKSVRDCIIKCLFDVIFSTEKMILKTELEEIGIFPHDFEKAERGAFPLTSIMHLKGSFKYTGISFEDISFSNQSPNSNEDNLLSVEEKINYLFESLDLHITRCCQKNMELSHREVQNVLLTTKDEVELIGKCNNKFTLKITAVVKLFIHVSSFIQTKFDEHNANYEELYGIHARLEMYKLQVKEHFIAYIKDRKAEETAAKQICIVMENMIREKIKERLPVAVKSALLNSITHLKFHLMLEMLQDMANNDDFDSFIDYIHHPKLFAEKWITKKSEEYLFDSALKKYSELAEKNVAEFYDALRESAKSSVEVFEKETPSIETWIKCFTSKFSKFTVSLSSFSDIHKILENIEDMQNFLSVLIEQMSASETNLNKGFKDETSMSVKWSGQNPYESLIQKAWGCAEQCAFCGEPCAKDTNHDGVRHYSLQHRLSCCTGARQTLTKLACITSCNYNVHSDIKHHCNVFNFLCNPIRREECDVVWHEYKDYRKYLSNWDIEPNPNMQDCGKFWLWFVAKYKQKLAAHYNYDVSNVPPAWDGITKAEALENLRRIYTGSS